jgi:Ni/Fe-hydrogenase subunit HybB-like protein
LLELVGFAAVPMVMYVIGYREKNVRLVRIASVIAVIGVVLNRLNVSCFAFNWELPVDRWYLPSLWEIWVSVFFVTLGLLAFRWVANRMPILREHPDYRGQH